MSPEEFTRRLVGLEFTCTFNPYSDRCPVYDAPDAPRVRARIMLAMLRAASQVEIDAIWIGRDLGYRGGRRTGLALTDDLHMEAHLARWGLPPGRATRGEAVSERTAAVIWAVLADIRRPVFLWNVFPLHPHQSEDPFTNRAHNAKEREAGEEVLLELIHLLTPRRLVAIGNDAAASTDRIHGAVEVTKVRHPSYGGQTEFTRHVKELYSLPERSTRCFVL